MGKGRALGRVLDGRDGEGVRPSTLPSRRIARRGASGQAGSEVRVGGASHRGRRLVSEIGVLPTAERFSRVPSMIDSSGVQVPHTT